MNNTPLKPASVTMLKIIERCGAVERSGYIHPEWSKDIPPQVLDGLVRRRLVTHGEGCYRLTFEGAQVAAASVMPDDFCAVQPAEGNESK